MEQTASQETVSPIIPESEDHIPKCCWFFDPSYNRFIAMFLLCFGGFLFTSVYDVPASLESEIEKTFDIETYQYEYLYSFYSTPSIVMCFFNGMLTDKIFGVRLAISIFAVVGLISQIVITAAAFAHLYWMMVVGRFFLGIAFESLGVTAICFATIWFKDKELNFVVGLIQSLSRTGSSFIFLISPPILALVKESVPKYDVLGLTIAPCCLIALVLILNSFVLGQLSVKCGKNVGKSSDASENDIKIKQIVSFPLNFWFLVLFVALNTSTIYSFVSCSQQLFARKYNLTDADANVLSSLFNIFGAVTAPFTGLLVDKIGRNLLMNFVGIALGVVSQIYLAFTQWTPYVALIMLACNFSVITSCAWPLIAYIVEDYQCGTAFGIFASALALFVTVSNLLAGYLIGKFGPFYTIIFYLVVLTLSLIVTVVSWVLDSRGSGVLNMSARQRNQIALGN